MKINEFSKMLLVLIIVLAAFAIPVIAEDNIKVLLNGTELSFDAPPKSINDRTMVSMRKIFEELGAEVNWKDETQTVTATKDDIIIIMQIDNVIISVNGKDIELDVPPQLVDNRTLVPVRAVAEGLQADVKWDGNTQTVIITKEEKSDIPINSDTAIIGNISKPFDTVWLYDNKAYALEFNRAPEWEKLPIHEGVTRFCIVNGYIYYLYYTDETDSWLSAIYRCDLDGSNIIKLTDDVIEYFYNTVIVDDYIFYANRAKDSEGIYRLNLTTLENSCVVKDKYLELMFADSEFVYYKTSSYYSLNITAYRVKFDGGEKTENDAYLNLSSFYSDGQYLYYGGDFDYDPSTNKFNHKITKINKNDIKKIIEEYNIAEGAGGGGATYLFDGFFYYTPRSFSEEHNVIISELYKININDKSQNIKVYEFISKDVNCIWFVGDYIYFLLFDNYTYSRQDKEVMHYSIHKMPIDGDEMVFTGKEWILEEFE